MQNSLDKILNSGTKIKIVRFFVFHEADYRCTGSQVARMVKVSAPAAHAGLKELDKEQILKLEVIGKQHIYHLNYDNRLVKDILIPSFKKELAIKEEDSRLIANDKTIAPKNDYDAIIIGAGISGLVCGCYLAKAGLKTLIVEKNVYPGGYCCSFKRGKYKFDACVHALSSLRSGGLLNKFFKELGITERINFNRHDPTDIIITPDFKINISQDINKTISSFQKVFPNEKSSLERFFKYLYFSKSFFEHRSKNFDELLNIYFSDAKLKNIFSTIIFLIAGCPTYKISAVVACLLYKEFVCDGGYYPVGGIQTVPDTLKQRFKEYGGQIIFDAEAKKIIIENNTAMGIVLKNKTKISSEYVISASDFQQTMFNLIDASDIQLKRIEKIRSLEESSPGFIVYIGIKGKRPEITELKSNIYLMTNHDSINAKYSQVKNCTNDFIGIHVPSVWDKTLNMEGRMSICLATNTDFHEEKFWNKEKRKEFADRLIKLAEIAIPNLSKEIDLCLTATPNTLNKWTRNHNGSAYGWAGTVEQFGNPELSQKTWIKNLFITGHWSNQSSGVSFVSNCGYDTADLILHNKI